jgi:hypothetical protein
MFSAPVLLCVLDELFFSDVFCFDNQAAMQIWLFLVAVQEDTWLQSRQLSWASRLSVSRSAVLSVVPA